VGLNQALLLVQHGMFDKKGYLNEFAEGLSMLAPSNRDLGEQGEHSCLGRHLAPRQSSGITGRVAEL
jgi:hypothetical protein